MERHGNAPAFLAFCNSLFTRSRCGNCVADNASTDASCEVVEREFPSVRLIRLDRNYGFAEGYNRALSQIEAQYVVLLNSDVEVTPGWLDVQIDYMEAIRR